MSNVDAPLVAENPPPATVLEPRQYTLRQIVEVWAAAALPMGLLAWVVAPALADRLDGPAAWPRALVGCLTVGLVWQAVLVLVLVRRETGTFRWPAMADTAGKGCS